MTTTETQGTTTETTKTPTEGTDINETRNVGTVEARVTRLRTVGKMNGTQANVPARGEAAGTKLQMSMAIPEWTV